MSAETSIDTIEQIIRPAFEDMVSQRVPALEPPLSLVHVSPPAGHHLDGYADIRTMLMWGSYLDGFARGVRAVLEHRSKP